MSEISTQRIDASRAVSTEKQRKDAVLASSSEDSSTAKAGQGGGKALPSESVSQDSTQQSTRAEDAARVEQAVSKLNDYVQSLQRDLRFSVDDSTGQAVVRVIDRSTDQVVRQIPNDVALRLARNLSAQGDPGRGYGDSATVSQLDLVNTRI